MRMTACGLAALLALAPAAATAQTAKVKVDGGALAGVTEGGVNVFKGVPFAKPPVGELRWKPPQRITWTGERAADKYALPCPQPVNANGTTNGGGVAGPTSEDCLYLNVWAPKNARNECSLYAVRTTVERETTSPRPDTARKAFDDLFNL